MGLIEFFQYLRLNLMPIPNYYLLLAAAAAAAGGCRRAGNAQQVDQSF
jgi:hypothetical protein